MDNIWLSFTTPDSENSDWKFNYNYVLVSPKPWYSNADEVENVDGDKVGGLKTIIGHKFVFSNDNVRLCFGELANVYNKLPTFFDLSPLVIYHNGNQDKNVNVTLYTYAEGKVGPIRIYGTYVQDDFDLPGQAGKADRPPG